MYGNAILANVVFPMPIPPVKSASRDAEIKCVSMVSPKISTSASITPGRTLCAMSRYSAPQNSLIVAGRYLKCSCFGSASHIASLRLRPKSWDMILLAHSASVGLGHALLEHCRLELALEPPDLPTVVPPTLGFLECPPCVFYLLVNC